MLAPGQIIIKDLIASTQVMETNHHEEDEHKHISH
jgi:hypothetical protein